MNEIPTPETDAFMLEYNRALASMKTRPSLWEKMQSLERRLTIEKNRAEGMGKLAHANACEAMEYRRLLAVAREALAKILNSRLEIDQAEIIAEKALIQTAPEP